jgi:hypothetical protein
MSRGSNSKTLVLSGLTGILFDYFVQDTSSVEVLLFDPGVSIVCFASRAFQGFPRLKSIAIPASVKFIDAFCFDSLKACGSGCPVETVTFAPGSRLRVIGDHAFAHCMRLKSICLPASVRQIHGRAFRDSGLSRIEIEPGNDYFSVRPGLLVSTQPSISAVCCFGGNPEVMIDDDIEAFGEFCFSAYDALKVVRFGSSSRIPSIGVDAFQLCCNLTSISVPSSVKILGKRCFEKCPRLSNVSFFPDSVLELIPVKGFKRCKSLETIVIPASVTRLGRKCFFHCSALRDVSFQAGSKLDRLEHRSFARCIRLQSLLLPSSVRFVELSCFEGCASLARLTFSSPSALTELGSFPSVFVGPFEVPDSVTVCNLSELDRRRDHPVLSFGRDSKLHSLLSRRHCVRTSQQTFLRVPSSVLKTLRAEAEFSGCYDRKGRSLAYWDSWLWQLH